jgi:hypothetical protein
MSKYGDAIMRRHDDGTVTVERADPVIGVSKELLDEAESWVFPNGDQETIQLDTAGEYLYRRTGSVMETWGGGEPYQVVIYERIEP